MSIDWHERFIQQARWTKTIRDYLLADIDLENSANVLEVGCGTGAILSELASRFSANVYGLDVDFYRTTIAIRNYQYLNIQNADAAFLPFSAGSFDLVFCHYFILWLDRPQSVLREAFRVLKSGGVFVAFAEPDYDNRVDVPHSLAVIGDMQSKSLYDQGANPGVGKELAQLVANSGFQLLKFGVPGYEHPEPGLPLWWDSEWQVISQDLNNELNHVELDYYKELDRQSWLAGDRVLWVPTYYALARKP